MNEPSQGGGAPAPAPKKNIPAAILSLLGGLLMIFSGIQTFRGHGNNLLFILAFGLMIGGMALNGQLNKKIG